MTDNTVVKLAMPQRLDRIGTRIDDAWKRVKKSDADWVSASLELAQALAEGREAFPFDGDFGKWLKENNHDHVGKNDRAALLGFSRDPELAREVFQNTKSRSYQDIWESTKSKFPGTRKPRRKSNDTNAEKAQPKPKKDDPARLDVPWEPHAMEAPTIDLVLQGLSDDAIAAKLKIGTRDVRRYVGHERIRRETRAIVERELANGQPITGTIGLEEAHKLYLKALTQSFPMRNYKEQPNKDYMPIQEAFIKEVSSLLQSKSLHIRNTPNCPLTPLIRVGLKPITF